MKITILAHGSRGDVQPYLALALGLSRAGHHVRLAAPEVFRAMVRDYAHAHGASLEFAILPGDPTRLMRAAAAPSPLASALPGSVRMAVTVVEYVAPVVRELIYAARAACADADLVIHTLLTTIVGHQIAKERGIADLSALVFPVFSPTRAFPNPLFTAWPGWARRFGHRAAAFSPRWNYLTHREFNRVFWHGNRMIINYLRRDDAGLILPLEEWPFGHLEVLPPETCPSRPTPILYGISPSALPCPEDWRAAESPAGRCARLTGYWFLDHLPGWQPPEGLVRFLESGQAPVFIGFGSLIPRDARRLAAIAMEALRETGQRGILLGGWGGLRGEHLPETVYSIDQVPFDWLYPQLAAAVHHGGMGTTAAALRAGIPSVAVPFTFDQPFWARQLHALGAGPRPIPHRRLDSTNLAAAIRAVVEDPSYKERAAVLSAQIRAEDGVQAAVRLISELV